MMHPSRQAYVEEEEPEVSSDSNDSHYLEVFMKFVQSSDGSILSLSSEVYQRAKG